MSNDSAEPLPRLGDPPEEAPSKFWMRFSLRSLLAITLLACMVLAWFVVRSHKEGRQRAVLASLEAYQVDAGWSGGTVVQLSFSGETFRNDALERLAELSDLKRIVLINTAANAETLKLLARYPQLTELLIIDAPLGDEALEHLKALTNLQILWLNNTRISDEGLKHLSPLKSLRRLNLRETSVGDEGLEHLRPLGNLESLYLESTNVTAAGIDSLKQSLPNTRIVLE